ncbi:MAG: hypothetical protein ACO3FE_11280 [Planctomycetaceae bacterium]
MTANNPLLLQRADAPGIELVAYLFPIVVARCNSQVAIIGTAIHRMQLQLADLTVLDNGFLDDSSLRLIEQNRGFGHSLASLTASKSWETLPPPGD